MKQIIFNHMIVNLNQWQVSAYMAHISVVYFICGVRNSVHLLYQDVLQWQTIHWKAPYIPTTIQPEYTVFTMFLFHMARR